MSNKTFSFKDFDQEVKNISALASVIQKETNELIESTVRSFYAIGLFGVLMFGIIALFGI